MKIGKIKKETKKRKIKNMKNKTKKNPFYLRYSVHIRKINYEISVQAQIISSDDILKQTFSFSIHRIKIKLTSTSHELCNGFNFLLKERYCIEILIIKFHCRFIEISMVCLPIQKHLTAVLMKLSTIISSTSSIFIFMHM